MVPLDDPSPSRPPNPHLWTSLKSPFEKHRHCWENATRFSGWWLVVEPTPLKNMSLSVGILKFSRYGHLKKTMVPNQAVTCRTSTNKELQWDICGIWEPEEVHV